MPPLIVTLCDFECRLCAFVALVVNVAEPLPVYVFGLPDTGANVMLPDEMVEWRCWPVPETNDRDHFQVPVTGCRLRSTKDPNPKC